MKRSIMKRSIGTIALAALLLLQANLHAAEPARGDFASALPIGVKGGEGLYAGTLPLSVYSGTERRDLGDMRVFNGAGETVPYSLLTPPATDVEKRQTIKVPIFPLYAQTGIDASALSVRIEQNARGTIVNVRGAEKGEKQQRLAGYILDTTALKKPMQALVIDWEKGKESDATGFTGRVQVDSSDDFKSWTCQVCSAPLMSLQHEGQSLTVNRVELPHVTAKYLRLMWPALQATPAFTQVQIEPAGARVDTPRTWHTVSAEAGKNPGEFVFDLNAHAPVDRLRFALPNANTVATVQLSTRGKSEDKWRPLISPTIYRLTRGGQEIVSPDIEISPMPDRYWMLKLDPRTSIGQGLPRLTVGFVPQKIVFAARGSEPFALAYGNAKATGAGIPITSLVPDYKDDKPLEAGSASFGTAQAQELKSSSLPKWLDLGDTDWRKVALWSVLVIGVILLGWMAMRLGKQIKTD